MRKRNWTHDYKVELLDQALPETAPLDWSITPEKVCHCGMGFLLFILSVLMDDKTASQAGNVIASPENNGMETLCSL